MLCNLNDFIPEDAFSPTIVKLPTDATDFVAHIKNELLQNYNSANSGLEVEENAEIKNGKLVLRKITGKIKPKNHKELDVFLDKEMRQINLLDIIATITKN